MSSLSSAAFTRPDARLLALRPLITEAAGGELLAAMPPAGQFLHNTLRPLLKLQNELLLQLVADFVRDHHMPFTRVAVVDQQRQLTELLARNTKLRYTIIGLITGLFTTDEYAFYRANRPEVNRRLLELAQQRVLSQVAMVGQLLGATPL